MRERSILFSAPMVRAILEGRKTQTRRIVKVRHDFIVEDGVPYFPPYVFGEPESIKVPCPYGAPGDRLWVKETHAIANGARCVAYRADGECGAWFDDGGGGRVWWRHGGIIGPEWHRPESWRGGSFGLDKYGGRWRPSIHMPRWASRIDLDISGVRVERLQAITEADAKAEGVRPFFEVYDRIGRDQRICSGEIARDAEHRASFACLWDEINGDRVLWSANPWVWVVEFSRIEAQERAA